MEGNRFIREGKRGVIRIVFGRTGIIIALLIVQFLLLFLGLGLLGRYVPYFFGGVTVLTAVMLVVVLNTKDDPTVKLTWCIVIALLPAFGALLYWFIRADLGHRLEKRLIGQVTKESQAYAAPQEGAMEALAQEDKGVRNLAAYLRSHGDYCAYGNTDVTYFPFGKDKFQELLRQLKQAKQFIFMEYFIIENGFMWGSILEVLARKAKEGVEVRVLYDGTCAVTLLPYTYPKELRKLGIQCKMFSPLHPFVSTHYNNRDHRKILVIDGKTAFTGGINLADEYIGRKIVHGKWKDTAVMLQGDAARSFTLMFLRMWNATERKREYAPYLLPPAPVQDTEKGFVIPYGDDPLDDDRVGEQVYLDMLNRATDYMYFMTPYLILDGEMVNALTYAAKRGVDVRLILPHIPDKRYVYILARSHYKELISAGVKVYEYTPGFVHAKTALADGREAVVGSINLDYRSLYLHFECAAYLYKVPAIRDIQTDFQETLAQCQEITMEDVRRIKLPTRLAGAVMRVVAPLM